MATQEKAADTKTAPPAAPEAPKGPPFIVTNVKPRLVEISIHKIGPGDTVEIPPEHVEGVRKSAAFRSGTLVEGKPVLPASVPIDITKIDPARAQKLIDTEDDVSILTAWIDAEKRPDVIKMLQARVKAL